MMRIPTNGRILLFLFGVLILVSHQTSLAQPPLTKTHKLRISDRKLAAELLGNGAELVADYGGFEVLAVDEALESSVPGLSAEKVTKQSIITLNAGSIDTTLPAIQALRTPTGPGSGKRLHLVQFAGPVKPEWKTA